MIRQEKIDEIKKDIVEERVAASFYTNIAKVIEKWDGKVYNKRMSEDLRAVTDNSISCDKKDNRLYMHYHKKNGGRWPWIQLINIDFEELENKRINSDLLLTKLRERRERLLTEAQLKEYTLEDLDILIEQIDSIKKTCRALFENVPYEILDAIGQNPYSLKF